MIDIHAHRQNLGSNVVPTQKRFSLEPRSVKSNFLSILGVESLRKDDHIHMIVKYSMNRLFRFLFVSSMLAILAFSAHGDELSADSGKEIQTTLHNMVGKWVYDIDFTRENLQKSAELQKLWCGYGWDESEISRRESFIRSEVAKKGPILTYEISDIGGGSLKMLIQNNEKETKTKVISECKKQKLKWTPIVGPVLVGIKLWSGV